MPDTDLPVKFISPVPVEVANTEPLQVETTAADKALPQEVRITEDQTPIAVTLPDEPIKVELPGRPAPTYTTSASGKESLSPTTTEQQDIVVKRQSDISKIWELTQAAIAVMTTMAMIYTAVVQIESLVLTSAFFLIIGAYFSRTNHSKIGGVGPKANEYDVYRGR